jgi:hypothetical protein
MKRLIIATTAALGLACVGGTSTAQDDSRTTNLQNVRVTAAQGQYETYIVDLHAGYQLQALVGNTHRQYVQAQRAAESSEALRKQGVAPLPFVMVAIDNSSGPGIARQIQLSDPTQGTVAIVNVYCRRTASEGGRRCRMAPQHVWNRASGQGLASRQVGRLKLAFADPHG